MGGEPLYTMLLLGLGIRQLSMPPHQLPEIKRVIRGIRLEDGRRPWPPRRCADGRRRTWSSCSESALRQAVPERPAWRVEPAGGTRRPGRQVAAS